MTSAGFRWLVLAVALAAVAGCRAEEQGRPLSHDKGTYGGPRDAALSEATRHALAERALQSIGLDQRTRSAVSPAVPGSTVRPPVQPSG